MRTKNIILTAFLAAMSLGMTACSSSGSWVSGATLSATQKNGDEWVQLSTQLSTGSMSMTSISMPVMNPQNLSEEVGEIDIIDNLTGGATLNLSVDLTAIMSLPITTSSTLPNGTAIPISGVNAQNWIALPVANGKSILYLNADLQTKTIALGAAVSISQLQIGVPASILLPFSVSNVSGVAGIYTGMAAGQSGLAIFVDASSLLPASSSNLLFQKSLSPAALQVQRKLLELNSAGTRLHAD